MKKTMHQASTQPVQAIDKITYPGQPFSHRMYKEGYEHFLNEMPVLDHTDPFLKEKIALSNGIMQNLAYELRKASWVHDGDPGMNGFNRTIIGIEEPQRWGYTGGEWKEGIELLVAKWGHNKTSPIHGHTIGFLYEDLLFGKLKVNTYRMTSPTSDVVRIVKTNIIDAPGTFASSYTPPGRYHFPRPALIHNFSSIGFSASLHYVSEHTRDGRDNKFKAEYFEDYYDLRADDVDRIYSQDGMYLPKGEVVLVRSTNVPEYGDHYIVITGAPVLKPHGLRPQDVAIDAPNSSSLLDRFESRTGLILLRLDNEARNAFHRFHGITVTKEGVTFPEPTPLQYEIN